MFFDSRGVLGVHDNSVATPFAHASLHAVGNTNACAQCTEISIPKYDGHTYIHTYRRKTRCEAGQMSCLALRRLAIILLNEVGSRDGST